MCVLMSTIIGIKNANSLVWCSVPYRIYSYIHIIHEYSVVAMLCVVILTPATWNAWILAGRPWYHIGVRIGAYLIILNSAMNSHWPYNMCVILLRSMQTFAGLRDSSLPDPCLSTTHYGTTKVTINCQCTEKLNTTLSVEKRSDRKITLVLMSSLTIGRLCRQSLGHL